MEGLTDHAYYQIKNRIGIKGPRVEEYVKRVYYTGRTPDDFTGRTKKYLENLALENEGFTEVRVKGNDVYIFGRNACLVTMFPLSKKVLSNKK